MATHKFGIMQNEPINNERFDEYEPNKYHCIAIDDNFIEPIGILVKFQVEGLHTTGLHLYLLSPSIG